MMHGPINMRYHKPVYFALHQYKAVFCDVAPVQFGAQVPVYQRQDSSLNVHTTFQNFQGISGLFRRSQWPRGLRRRSVAVRLLRMWVRIPPGGMDVCLL